MNVFAIGANQGEFDTFLLATASKWTPCSMVLFASTSGIHAALAQTLFMDDKCSKI